MTFRLNIYECTYVTYSRKPTICYSVCVCIIKPMCSYSLQVTQLK